MNLARLRGAVTKNKVAIGALGAVAVGALAWRARTEGATSNAGPASDVRSAVGTSAAPSSYTAGAAPYDSTATDLYNAFQPQLEKLQDLYDRLPVPGEATTPAPAPIPAPTQAPARSIGNVIYQRDDGQGGAWFELYDDFSKRWISAAEAKLSGVQPGVVLNDVEIAAYSKEHTP